MIKIAPCPFCRRTDLDVSTESDFNLLQRRNGGIACIAVRCWNCNAEMFDHTYSEKDYNKRLEMLLTKWNRRAGDD